ncbi:LysR family transcriptional regulator [Paenibacillus sp. P25]|nr:LysR family transcriptional regulator [Paenibacillus sp. P25]
MDLGLFTTFREVAKQQSYTKAAETLGYVQSSVTAQMQKLEKAYGVALFDRIGGKMHLTQAGRESLKYADRSLEVYEESRQAVSGQETGSIVIGTIETLAAFFLPPPLHRFREMYPRVNVMLRPGAEPDIVQAVREGECDFGLLLDLPFTDPELHCIQIREEAPLLLASPQDSLHGKPGVRPCDLADKPLVVTEASCTYRAALERELRGQGVRYHLAYELGSVEAIKQCILYGLGTGFLPAITVREELVSGRLVQPPFQLERDRFYTQLIYHKKKRLTAALEKFIQLAAEAVIPQESPSAPRPTSPPGSG